MKLTFSRIVFTLFSLALVLTTQSANADRILADCGKFNLTESSVITRDSSGGQITEVRYYIEMHNQNLSLPLELTDYQDISIWNLRKSVVAPLISIMIHRSFQISFSGPGQRGGQFVYDAFFSIGSETVTAPLKCVTPEPRFD